MNSTDALAKELNELYYGYQPGLTAKMFGVTIRWIQTSHATDGKWFYCQHDCFKGGSDCRVSASMINSKIMIRTEGDAVHLHDAFGVALGVIFDQEMVEQTLAKCYYTYDAGTDDRYNRGCGCSMAKEYANCSSPQSAYHNLDPKTGNKMSSASDEVVDCHCGGKLDPGEPKQKNTSQCYWKGPAFFPNDGKDELAQMMNCRIDDQTAKGAGTKETEYWNEVVMDGLVVKQHSSKAVKAVVWMKGDIAETRETDAEAYKVAQDMAKYFEGLHGSAPPIVALDPGVDVKKCGPFGVWKPSLQSHIV